MFKVPDFELLQLKLTIKQKVMKFDIEMKQSYIDKLTKSGNYHHLINKCKRAEIDQTHVYVIDEFVELVKLKELVWNEKKQAIDEIKFV